jgi:hypothetical protein
MPIPTIELATQILAEMQAAGEQTDEKPAPAGLPALLKKHRLDPDSLLTELRELVEDPSPHIKMRGVEAGLKLNKLLDDDGPKVQPTFIINIASSDKTIKPPPEINPILLPRELTT